jgi:hypothetical protein
LYKGGKGLDKYPSFRKCLAVGIIPLFIGASIIPSSAQNISGKSFLILSRGGDHVPIYIYGNDEFTAENGVTDGNGTVNNPYLIENWVFVGSEDAIFIRNTTVFFIIRNCTIRGFQSGIAFYQVANGRVEETIIDKCVTGTLIDDSQNIMITGNTINSDIINLGLDSVYNINVSRNTFTGWVVIGGTNDYIFSYNTLNINNLHIRGNCIVYRNNFMPKPPDIGVFLLDIYIPVSSHVIFLQNYWWASRLFPKLNLGEIYKPGGDHPDYVLHSFFIDWYPAQEPYNMPNMS